MNIRLALTAFILLWQTSSGAFGGSYFIDHGRLKEVSTDKNGASSRTLPTEKATFSFLFDFQHSKDGPTFLFSTAPMKDGETVNDELRGYDLWLRAAQGRQRC